MKLTILLLAASTAVSCGSDKGKPSGKNDKPSTPDRPVAAVKQLDPATVGTIRGVVSFEGAPPSDRELGITETACRSVHDSPPKMGKVLVADGKLQNVFVYIASGLDGYAFAPPDTEVVVNQHGCIYEPLVVGVQVGQKLTFVNGDPVLHNIHTVPEENDGANFAMPSQGMRVSKTFDVPEIMVPTKCDVHPWMRAYIGVVDHPHFAVTGADGAFELKGVPPGDYTVGIWHEQYGVQSVKVTLPPSGEAAADFTVTAK